MLKFQRISQKLFYVMFQFQMHRKQMFHLMFQHRASSKYNQNSKIKDKKVKNTMHLLTQFGDKHTYSGGYQARKEIHQCTPYFIALSKLLVCTKDLGPTCIDFNLGTPRSEIPSHYPMVSHSPCDLSYQKQTNTKMKLPSHKNYTLLKSFGVSQPTQLLASQLRSSTHEFTTRSRSLTCIKLIQERLTNNQN